MTIKEIFLFNQALRKVQFYLKPIGMQIDDRDINRSTWERLRLRRFLAANIMLLIFDIGGEITWFIKNINSGKSFVELTNLVPCMGLVVFGVVQTLSFFRYSPVVCELIASIRVLLLLSTDKDCNDNNMFLKGQMKVFRTALNSLAIIKVIGISGFGISPLVYTAMQYYNTGEIKLKQPFLISYPFDTTDIRYFPIAYVALIWSAIVGVLTVLGPYYLCYACSTFIIYLFRILKKDIEKIIPYNHRLSVPLVNEDLKKALTKLIDSHRKLIRCVELMEIIYSETILFNVVTSSLLICFTGFNVMVMEDLTLALPFLQFLLLGLVQTYFLCYYGDMIILYSSKIGEAVYNCQWYRADPSIIKDLFIIAARARKPCKLTAFGFSDINFMTFTKILSTSWSYFAILKTQYNGE